MTYKEKVKIMTDYMKLEIFEKDWHGVADAAMDLRDIENFEAGSNLKPQVVITGIPMTLDEDVLKREMFRPKGTFSSL